MHDEAGQAPAQSIDRPTHCATSEGHRTRIEWSLELGLCPQNIVRIVLYGHARDFIGKMASLRSFLTPEETHAHPQKQSRRISHRISAHS